MKDLLALTKSGIVFLSWLCASIGYFVGVASLDVINLYHFGLFSVGLILLSSGSLALNQVQESDLDEKMDRTSKRPIPSGRISLFGASAIAFGLMSFGLGILMYLNPLTASLGLVTILLYNGFYTLIWKPRWAFGAVPGAIPGAMPVVLGFSAVDPKIYSLPCVYLFLLMFLWQMPHFWALTLKFKDDYKKAGVPVLPVVVGEQRTVLHIGIYTIVYLAVALSSPFFLPPSICYVLFVLPFSTYLLIGLFQFARSDISKSWFAFFMKVNASLLVFLMAALLDRWVVFGLLS